MNIKKFYLIFFPAILLALIFSVNFDSSAILGNIYYMAGGPKLVFTEKQKDFGKILQGDIVQYEFDFVNEGDETLEIDNVQTSCGCTAATVGEKDEYLPGEKGKIRITFNSNGKVGVIEKTVLVESNDKVNDHIILSIMFDIKLPTDEQKMHMTVMSGQSIFSSPCSDCHVTKGIGKIGKELYDADCGICHGDSKDHKPHGPIDKNTAVKYTDDELVNYIKNGSPDKPGMMPGFHKDNGGPLTTEEIMTLLSYIRSDLSINSYIH